MKMFEIVGIRLKSSLSTGVLLEFQKLLETSVPVPRIVRLWPSRSRFGWDESEREQQHDRNERVERETIQL